MAHKALKEMMSENPRVQPADTSANKEFKNDEFVHGGYDIEYVGVQDVKTRRNAN